MSGTKIDGKTADQHRDDAAASYQRASDSFDRSDTDGFVTQWAAGLTGDLSRRKAQIADDGGLADFQVLVNGDDVIVPSRIVDTRYGAKRIVLDDADNAIAWVPPHAPIVGRNGKVGRLSPKLVALGLSFATVSHPATAVMDGRGTGLSGTAWVATKPVCGSCDAIIRTIGQPCRCGHTTPVSDLRRDDAIDVYARDADA